MTMRAPDAFPQCIVDMLTGEVFNISVMTLIHLGATNITLYSKDLEQANYQPSYDKYILMGRPNIPAIFSDDFSRFTELSQTEKLNRITWFDQYKLIKLCVDERVECEDMSHYLLKNNLVSCYKKVTEDNFNYLACPTSPMGRLALHTAGQFVDKLKALVDQYDLQILLNMTSDELMYIKQVPEELAVKFFELLEIEDTINFKNERTLALQ